MVVGVVVLVVVVPGGRGGALGGHDLREPGGRGARGDVLRAAHVGDAPDARGAGAREGGRGGGGGGAVVRGGDAARGGGARAAPAALPPVDGAPRPETVHGGPGLAGAGRDLGRRERAVRGEAARQHDAEMARQAGAGAASGGR